jgi:hypothetical protein
MATFCTAGIASNNAGNKGKIISNNSIADSILNNIFVTLRTALY